MGNSRRHRSGSHFGRAAESKPAKAASKKSAADSKKAKVALPVPAALSLEPSKFELRGHRASLQLVTTGKYATNRLLDLTADVKYTSSESEGRPRRGLRRSSGCRWNREDHRHDSATARPRPTVVVSGMETPAYVSFKNETLPALTKAGCNMGACHGSPSGKAGFRLSLRGFDPPLDVVTLRTEYFNRRTNIMDPAESLILKKPLMEVAHGGGRRLHKGDASYRVLFDWISEGLRLDAADAPDLVKIEVFPSQRVFHALGTRQQLRVNGYFSDGTVRDLTPLTVFSSSNESVATVSATGLVEKTGRGETAILARLLDKMSTGYMTFLEDVKGFAWTNPPANNFVDTLVFEKLKQLQILPSDLCSDEEFIRRAYLDATGRLPRPEESLAFLNAKSADKRARLVDELVDSPDAAEFWTLEVVRHPPRQQQEAGAGRRAQVPSLGLRKRSGRQAARPVRPRAVDRPRQRFREPRRQLLARQPRPAGRHRDDGPVVPGHPHPVREVPQPSLRALVAGQLLRHRGGLRPRRPQSRAATPRTKKSSSPKTPAKSSSRAPARR